MNIWILFIEQSQLMQEKIIQAEDEVNLNNEKSGHQHQKRLRYYLTFWWAKRCDLLIW